MRRRRPFGAPRTPEAVVTLWSEARETARALHLAPDRARAFVHAYLAEHGTDVVEAIRARRWLRQGRRGKGWRG